MDCMLGAFQAEIDKVGHMDLVDYCEYNRNVDRLHQLLSEQDFQSGWEEGQALTLEEGLLAVKSLAEELF
jgi:hypothetical protein